jgi:hypothetical protein
MGWFSGEVVRLSLMTAVGLGLSGCVAAAIPLRIASAGVGGFRLGLRDNPETKMGWGGRVKNW